LQIGTQADKKKKKKVFAYIVLYHISTSSCRT